MTTAHILVVDDETEARDMLCYVFEREGWDVDTASTPNEMVELINRKLERDGHHYDLILADINYFGQTETPRQTGISAVADIRLSRIDVPVIFVSAYLNEQIREQAEEVGGEVHPKPVEIEQLIEQTRDAIERHRADPEYGRRRCTPITRSDFLQQAILSARGK